MKRLEKPALLFALFMVCIALQVGCGAFKKPVPENPPVAQSPAPAVPSQKPMPTSAEEVNGLAVNLGRAAARVPGVNGATVVIAGTTAYVAIDQKAGLEKSDTSRIKQDVGNAVKQAEPRLTAVYVSSDPDTVTRLKRIAGGIAAGQPVSTFDRELAEIAKRLSPTSS